MTQSSTFRLRTDEFPEKDRVAMMCEVYGRTVLKAELDPLGGEPFHVDMTARTLPGVGVATGNCSRFRVHHSSRLIDSDDLILLIALSGGSVMKHRGMEEPIDGTQALMMTGSEVGLNRMWSGLRFVNLSFSSQLLTPLIGDLSNVVMRPLSAAGSALALLVSYVNALQASGEAMTPELGQLAATHIIDLAALAAGATRDAAEIARGRGVSAARLRAIKADIAGSVGCGDLSTETIAARHGLSPRYVRKLFESEGTSFSAFLLGQRLSRAHRMLGDPRYDYLGITAIAFEAGFNDLSYFNRTFRRYFGATPSDIRAAAQSRD
jgi:AraC-like DNA-binding protein